jgi:preprotein translocase subunit SecE
MATKAAVVSNGGQKPGSGKRREMNTMAKSVGNLGGYYNNFVGFLSEVRAEMRKVVTPSRKEVQATTTVVIVAVAIFGVYFMVVDFVCQNALHAVLGRLGGF